MVHFKWKVRHVNFRLFETVQHRWNRVGFILFVVQYKSVRFFIFVTFHSFGSVKTECNGSS